MRTVTVSSDRAWAGQQMMMAEGEELLLDPNPGAESSAFRQGGTPSVAVARHVLQKTTPEVFRRHLRKARESSSRKERGQATSSEPGYSGYWNRC